MDDGSVGGGGGAEGRGGGGGGEGDGGGGGGEGEGGFRAKKRRREEGEGNLNDKNCLFWHPYFPVVPQPSYFVFSSADTLKATSLYPSF